MAPLLNDSTFFQTSFLAMVIPSNPHMFITPYARISAYFYTIFSAPVSTATNGYESLKIGVIDRSLRCYHLVKTFLAEKQQN